MPKPGYTTIVVKTSVRSRLQELARLRGYKTVNQLLKDLIAHGVNPRVNPTNPNTLYNGAYHTSETGLISGSVSRNKGGNLGTVGSGLAGPPGFEPGTLGLGGRCPILARPRAHIKI